MLHTLALSVSLTGGLGCISVGESSGKEPEAVFSLMPSHITRKCYKSQMPSHVSEIRAMGSHVIDPNRWHILYWHTSSSIKEMSWNYYFYLTGQNCFQCYYFRIETSSVYLVFCQVPSLCCMTNKFVQLWHNLPNSWRDMQKLLLDIWLKKLCISTFQKYIKLF